MNRNTVKTCMMMHLTHLNQEVPDRSLQEPTKMVPLSVLRQRKPGFADSAR